MSADRLILVRHGRTASNVARAMDTLPPGPPLDEVGRSQAAALARRLADEPITAVHASTAVRAQQTAEPVAAERGLAVQVLDGAHEISVGELENRSDPDSLRRFEQMYDRWHAGDVDARLPGGESAGELRARFTAAVRTATAASTGTVLLVSHGAAIRLGAAALIGDTAETAYLGNTGVVVLAADPAAPGGWVLEHWDPAPPRPGDVTAGAPPA